MSKKSPLSSVGFVQNSQKETLTFQRGVPHLWALEPERYSYPIESIRFLKNRIVRFQERGDVRVLALTGVEQKAGVSVVAFNLALISAWEMPHRRILIIDANMSRPSLHKSFDIDSGPGFVDILYGKTTITEVLQDSPFANLHLLPLGYKCERLPSPFTLESFQDFLGYVTEQYDLTIVDTEPVLQSSHAQYISSRTDGVVVIAEAGKSRLDDLIEMKTQLQNDGVHLIGSFLNRQRRIIPRWVTRFI